MSVSYKHRCLQAWAYQGNAQVDDASHTMILLKVGFTIVENNLSKHLEDNLVTMTGHTSFSTGASAYKGIFVAAE